MRTIWKFPLALVGEMQPVVTPGQPTVVHFARQGDALCLWAEVDDAEPELATEFLIVGTGHPIPEAYRYVATTIDGGFLWHLYRTPGSYSPSCYA